MKKIVLIFCSCLTVAMAFSQSNDILIRKLVEKQIITDDEADDILSSTTVNTTNANILNKISETFNNRYVKVGGYSQFLYSYSSMDRIKNNLSIRNAFISLSGNPIDNLSYSILYNLRSSIFTEGYIVWKPLSYISTKIGQQKIPLGIENNISSSKTEFIQNSLMTTYFLGGGKDVLSKQNGKNNGGRDIGINFFGEFLNIKNRNYLEYVVGVFQGSGINTSAMRSSKDLASTLFVKPIKGLKFGGGTYFGMVDYAKAENLEIGSYVRNRWIIGAEYKNQNKLTVRSEYVRAYDSNIQGEGGYIMGMYRFLPKFDFGLQWEYLRQNRKLSAHQCDYIAGLNYYMSSNTKLMLDYTFSDYSRQSIKNNHKVELQFVVSY